MANAILIFAVAFLPSLQQPSIVAADTNAMKDGVRRNTEQLLSRGIYVEYKWEGTKVRAGYSSKVQQLEMKMGILPDDTAYGWKKLVARDPKQGMVVNESRSVMENGVTKDYDSGMGSVMQNNWGVFNDDLYLQQLGVAWRKRDREQAATDPKDIRWLPQAFAKRNYQSGKSVAVDGHTCVVLVAAGSDKLWLDPELAFALRRREIYFPNGRIKGRYHFKDFKDVGEQLWLPMLIAWEFFPDDGKLDPQWTKETRVSRLDIGKQIDRKLMAFEFPVGTTVNDKIENKQYVVGAGGKEYFEKSISELRQKRRLLSTVSWTTLAIIGVNVLLGSVLLVMVYRRWRSK